MQRTQARGLGRRRSVNFKLIENRFKQLVCCECGIDHECGPNRPLARGLMLQNVLQAIKQSRFAGADWPNRNLQSFTPGHPFHHRPKRIAVRLRQMEEFWVRREPERFLL
jgi:hypothetical protein